MTIEKRMDLCHDHLATKTEEEKKAIYEEYGVEELKMSRTEAGNFASEMLKPLPDSYFKYLEFGEKLRFCFWYYGEHLAPYEPDTPTFPNGFGNWQESHFKVAAFITNVGAMHLNGLTKHIFQRKGEEGLHYLAQKWTDEFENRYRDSDWNKNKHYKTVEKFCTYKNQEVPSYQTVLEFPNGNYKEVFRLEEGEENDLLDDEIEDTIETNNLDVCFFHSRLYVRNTRDTTNEYMMNRFLTRHGKSPFVKQNKDGDGYHSIGVSILCNEKDIIRDLISLDMTGALS